ncbi:MAG: hypothetical protein ACRBEE_06490 [Arenicella sp.]
MKKTLLNIFSLLRKSCLLVSFSLISACAKPLLLPSDIREGEVGVDGQQLFNETFIAHGGLYFESVSDINISIQGNWSFWAPRIQPDVADRHFRVSSQERYLPHSGIYTSYYTGPAGNKKVVRTPESIDIYYNDEKSTQANLIQASAMTADAFLLFSLGPLYLSTLETEFQRLTDVVYKGQHFLRVYSKIKPGLGYAEYDEVVLWIHPATKLTYRVDVTLKGYPPTEGAHVDVFYLDYVKLDQLTIPVHVIENVVAPFHLKAHEWHVTGADVNRGLIFDDIKGKGWSDKAAVPAKPFLN